MKDKPKLFGLFCGRSAAGRALSEGTEVMRLRFERIRPIRNIADVCDFVLCWSGQESAAFVGPPLTSRFEIPECIQTLNSRLGRIWCDPDQVLSSAPSHEGWPRPKLFHMQNLIYNPGEYEKDEHGVVITIAENQYLYQVGFSPDRPEETLVRLCNTDDDDDVVWQKSGIPLEQLLIAEILQNFHFLCRARPDFFPPFNEFASAGEHDLSARFWPGPQGPSLDDLKCFAPYLNPNLFTLFQFIPEDPKQARFSNAFGS